MRQCGCMVWLQGMSIAGLSRQIRHDSHALLTPGGMERWNSTSSFPVAPLPRVKWSHIVARCPMVGYSDKLWWFSICFPSYRSTYCFGRMPNLLNITFKSCTVTSYKEMQITALWKILCIKYILIWIWSNAGCIYVYVMLRTGMILILTELYIVLNFERCLLSWEALVRAWITCRSRTFNILRDAYSFDVYIHNCVV